MKLITLGPPRLDAEAPGGGLKVSLGPSKPLALITYLAFAPRHTASRESLCDLLWGDWELDEARASLRQTLWIARRQPGLELADRKGDGVVLVTPLAVDADEFASAAHAGDLDHALSLYTGEFFAGFASPGAAEFERWAALERGRFRALFIHTADAVARRALDAGRFREAVDVARRMREADPYGEKGWRLSLEARAAAGDCIGARAEADSFEEWLRTEEREPEPASAAALRMARQLARPAAAPSHETDIVADLVGREQEFSELQGLWNEARTKGPRRVHIVGPSGIGKSRLTLDFRARLRASRARTVYRRANPGEQQLPFSFAAELAAALAALPGAAGISAHSAGALLALNPTLSSVFAGSADPAAGPEAVRRRALALSELLAAASDDAPLALFLDDLHWCDAESASIVAAVSAHLSTEHVLLVTTARPLHAVPTLPPDTTLLHLRPLDRDQIEQLIGSLGRLPSESWAAELPALVLECTQGNPLLALEALRLCLDRDVLQRADGEWRCARPVLLTSTLEVGPVLGRRLRGLDDAERALLLLLAVAGGPLPSVLVGEAAGLRSEALGRAIASLELRGLATSADNAWAVTHDAIAEAAMAEAREAEIVRVRASLGRVMAASTELAWRRRAIPFVAATGDRSALAAATLAVLARQHRSRAGLDDELAALLGPHGSAELIGEVRRCLPFKVRHPQFATRMVIAGVAVLLAATAEIAWTLRAPVAAPDAVITVTQEDPAGGFLVRRVPISRDTWIPMQAITVPRFARVEHWKAFPRESEPISPTHGTWAAEHAYPDSRGLDIDLVDRDGIIRRLTKSSGDDHPLSFSPDGTELLIATNRWDALGHSTLAILDVQTGVVRGPLTRDTWTTVPSAAWSPDGSRIEFVRGDLGSDARALCWVSVDAAETACHAIANWLPRHVSGWSDDHHVVVPSDSRDKVATLQVDVDSGTARAIPAPNRDDLTLDPSGRWAIATSGSRSVAGEVQVFSVGRFDRARPLAIGNLATARWWPSVVPRPFLARVAITRPAGALVQGVPYLFSLRGFDSAGGLMRSEVVEWKSLTPAVAGIDSIGVFVARDTGTTIVEGSAGGWRTVRDTIRVIRSSSTVLLDEHWDAGVESRWRYFGEPLPLIVDDGRGGHAFLNNGDGHFYSGAYLKRAFKSVHGLAVDAELSTPITRAQWQISFIFLEPASNLAALREWDHRTGDMPNLKGSVSGCEFGFPRGEGEHATDAASPFGSLRDAGGGDPLTLADGRWYRVRIQLLPDGRCGIAINGRAVFVGPPLGLSAEPRWLIMEGHSVGSRLLVGHVRVRTGVPNDVDWTRLKYDDGVWRPGKATAPIRR